MPTSMHSWDDDTNLFAHSVIGYAIERLRLAKDTQWGAHPAEVLQAAIAHALTPEGVGGLEALRLFRDVLLVVSTYNIGDGCGAHLGSWFVTVPLEKPGQPAWQALVAADTQTSTLNMAVASRFLADYDIDAHIATIRSAQMSPLA